MDFYENARDWWKKDNVLVAYKTLLLLLLLSSKKNYYYYYFLCKVWHKGEYFMSWYDDKELSSRVDAIS